MPPASEKSIGAAKEKLLDAFVELNYFGKTTIDINDACRSAGYKCITGKAIRAAISQLKQDGVFTRVKDEITLTEKGIAALPQVDASVLPTDQEKQVKMMEMILKEDPNCKPITKPEKTKAVFDVLLDGKTHTKLELAGVAGYQRLDTKQFRNLLKRMDKLGLLETVKPGSVRFTDSVWPIRGRPLEDGEKQEGNVESMKATKSPGKKIAGRKRKTLDGDEKEEAP